MYINRQYTPYSRAPLTLWLCLLLIFSSPPAMALNECDEWAARVVSVQGVVEARATDNHRWQVVKQGQTYCPNDMIHVRENSRAALELANETIIRLDQNTTIVLSGESEAASWLDLLKGAVHFITRTPNSLKIKTPYVNAAVEGTEFVIRVENGETTVSVIEGRVSLENKQGQLLLTDGQSASAREGEAPVRRLDIIPEDAVQWSLYYPSVIDKSLNNLDTAEKQPLIVAADHLLTVGRVREAEALLTRIHQQHPDNASAYAMQSIIALTQNRTEEAQALATTAFTLNPTSPAAAIALSYAQQAQFDLRTAHETLHMALRFTPDNSLLLARKAELLLSLGHLDEAEVMAQRAIGINPKQAHALTILGFSHLGQFEVERAKRYFERAISLNQADPLPRLGHGLAVIRNGKLTDGRREIEIAASLNPVNALIRSYLGKAYYEEKRNALAEDQFILAKSLDPLDPTPWFYDAIRKQTLNRPVEALQDLQQSIRLNDNRAVYRSRLLLDQDHAARSASLARIYNDLGFSQLALSEGWKSVSTDPTNHSAHRLLADSYSALPRHEIARVSELLQAQMLQPLNLNPIQPQLAESSLGILDGAGPANASANEFNPLFTRNRFSLQMNGVVASQDNDLDPAKKYNTRSVDMIHSGVWGRYSYSLGTFHDYNEGIRPNHDRDREIDNLFIQVAVDHNTSVQLEYRNTQSEEGDLPLRYDPALFSTNKRILIKNRIRRLGLRHDLAPGNTLLFSAIRQERTEVNSNSVIKQFPLPFSNTSFSENAHAIETGHTFELQHLLNYSDYRLISGIGTSRSDSEATINANFSPAFCPPSCIPSFKIDTDTPTRHHNGYLYAHINPSTQLTWTLGISIDDIEMEHKDDTQFNPKLGLTWQVNNSTMLRAAAFRSLKRRLTSNQTLEPTHISGFNQFYDDINGTESRRYGIALEKKYKTIQAGIELSRRDLTTLFSTLVAIAEPEWQERLHRAYLYWAPLNWLAASAEYQYESFKRPAENSVSQQDTTVGFPALRTHQLPLGITLFSASGFTTKITATYIDQKGLFSLDSHRLEKHAEDFWTMDASVSYRLNKRMGRITVGAKNLLGKNFRYHNVDFATNRIMPERMVFTHLSLSF